MTYILFNFQADQIPKFLFKRSDHSEVEVVEPMTQPGAFNGVVFFVHDMIEDRAQAWVQNFKFSKLINKFYSTNRKF